VCLVVTVSSADNFVPPWSSRWQQETNKCLGDNTPPPAASCSENSGHSLHIRDRERRSKQWLTVRDPWCFRAVVLKVYVVGNVRCVDRSILTDVSKVRFFQTSVTIYCPDWSLSESFRFFQSNVTTVHCNRPDPFLGLSFYFHKQNEESLIIRRQITTAVHTASFNIL
jgi:hypothetical protein